MSILNYIEKMKEMYEGPRITAQGPRNMYAGGQLVRNTVDGSRPGYDGKKVTAGPGQPVGGASEDFRTFLRGLDKKTLKDSKLADLISSSNVDIKKTLASNVLAEEEFLKIRPKRTLSKEDKVVLEKLLKNKTGRIESVKYKGVDYYKGTEGRIHTKGSLKADRPEAYKKVLSTLREHRGIIKSKNVFPAPGDDLKKAIWRDLYESTRKREYTKQAGKYEVPEPRLKLVSRPDNLTVSSVEDIILLDTKTNKKINYKNLERYVDSLPNTSYKDLELPYKYKNWLTDQTITYKGKTNVALRTVLRENLLTEGQLTNWRNSPYQVHHPFGINENPFKTQLAMHTANGKEGWIRLDTLKKLDAAGTDEKQIKKIMNSFKKKIKALPGGIQSGIGDELIGKALKPDEFMKTLFSKAKIGREARPLIKDFLSNFWCGTKQSVAGGGRIGFSGSCPVEVKQKNFLRMTNDVANGKITGEAAEQVVKNAGKVVAKAGSKSALATIFGPAGIGIDIAYEVGSVGWDVAKGKPWKEAVQDNWIMGAFVPGTGSEEFHKRLAKISPDSAVYGQAQDLVVSYDKMANKIARMKADTTHRGQALAKEQIPLLEKQMKEMETNYNTLTRDNKAMEVGSPEHEKYMAAVTELKAADRAKSVVGSGIKRMDVKPDRYSPRGGMKIDFSLPKPFEISETPLDANQLQAYAEYHRDVGDLEPRGELPQWYIDEIQQKEKWRQLFEQPGIRGTQDWRGADGGRAGYMGGGIAAIRKPHAIPPKRQGLRSIMINGKKS